MSCVRGAVEQRARTASSRGWPWSVAGSGPNSEGCIKGLAKISDTGQAYQHSTQEYDPGTKHTTRILATQYYSLQLFKTDTIEIKVFIETETNPSSNRH